MIIIEKWEKILNFNLREEVGICDLNDGFNDTEYTLIDHVSNRLLTKNLDYQDIVSSVCTELSEDIATDENNIDELYDNYCEIVYNLGMIPIEVSIFKGLNDAAIRNNLSLEDVENNRDYLVQGIVDIYRKYQETNEMSITSDINKMIYPILSK